MRGPWWQLARPTSHDPFNVKFKSKITQLRATTKSYLQVSMSIETPIRSLYSSFHSSPLSISLPRKEQRVSLQRPTSNVVHKNRFDVRIEGSQFSSIKPSPINLAICHSWQIPLSMVSIYYNLEGICPSCSLHCLFVDKI